MKNLLIFLGGFGLGFTAAYKFVSAKYDKLIDEEIEEMREHFKSKYETKKEETVAEVKTIDTKPDIKEYKSIIGSESYTNYNEPPKKDPEAPYVIEPGEFGTVEGYDESFLNYYSDGVLADEHNEPIDDVDDLVNQDTLSMANDEGIIYIRSDVRKTDYEITVNDYPYVDE